jgi:hypothetical protein
MPNWSAKDWLEPTASTGSPVNASQINILADFCWRCPSKDVYARPSWGTTLYSVQSADPKARKHIGYRHLMSRRFSNHGETNVILCHISKNRFSFFEPFRARLASKFTKSANISKIIFYTNSV